jgi:predicted lipoprotein with Yx(FWY)xxD motif
MDVGVLSGHGTTAGRRRARTLIPLAFGTLALTAACTGPYGGTSSAATPTAANPNAAVVATASTGLGTIVVNGTGRTVYEFGKDAGSMSTCTGGCASIWPPVAAPDPVPAALPGVWGQLGSTTRADGSKQLTIAGHPVYTYSGDNAAGDANGQGITLNGGVWNVVSPTGAPVTKPAATSSTSY